MVQRGRHTAAFAGMGALLVALTGADFAIDRALDSELTASLESDRQRVVRITLLRRAARRSYVEVLERRLSPSRRGADEIAALDAAREDFAALRWTEAEERLAAQLSVAAAAFAERCRAEIAAPGEGVPLQLADALSGIDAAAMLLLTRNGARGDTEFAQSLDSGLPGLERARLIEQAGLALAVLLTMGFGLRWIGRIERADAEKAAADRSRRDIERMAGVLAHEVNGQLTVLQHAVSILAREGPKSEPLRYQQESIDHMRELVADFRLFGGGERLAIGPVDAVAAARASVAAMGVAVEMSMPERLVVRSDEHALQRALMNLLRNAQEAGGPVRLRIEQAGGVARFTVEDEGPGLSPEQAARAGEPFFTTKTRGTGLGVAIVMAVARRHAGTFALRNRSGGRGAEAVLEIPL